MMLIRSNEPRESGPASPFALNGDVTPFTVISLLHRIRDNSSLSDKHRGELEESIESLERRYFGSEGAVDPVELQQIADTWLRKAA